MMCLIVAEQVESVVWERSCPDYCDKAMRNGLGLGVCPIFTWVYKYKVVNIYPRETLDSRPSFCRLSAYGAQFLKGYAMRVVQSRRR